MRINPKREPFEGLFKTDAGYIYVQYTAEDPDCDFDYTVYDDQFNDIDGGLIGESGVCKWDLEEAAVEINGGRPVRRLWIDMYRQYIE